MQHVGIGGRLGLQQRGADPANVVEKEMGLAFPLMAAHAGNTLPQHEAAGGASEENGHQQSR